MASSSTSTNQPNTTLYLNNLNDKVTTAELKTQLYALFTTYGKVIDIVSGKGKSKRGQAFLVFADLAGATTAMRACEGMVFYDKPIHINYAKTKSYATLRREDPNFVPPSMTTAAAAMSMSNLRVSDQKKKRPREDVEMENVGDEPKKKKDKKDGEDDEASSGDEEMEIEDEDEDSAAKTAPAPIAMSASNVPAAQAYPSPRLLCTNLPQEVTNDVLSVLFQQYRGFLSTQVTQSPTPQIKMAQVIFESPELAKTAKDALDGFALKKGWKMGVAYI